METLKLNSTGPEVELLQSALKKLGFYTGRIDGIFGAQTEAAVVRFQRNFGLEADGIVGVNTWNALAPYIDGYTVYTVKAGDTLFNLANRFSTTTNAIITANTNINSNNLLIGSNIVIPFSSVVFTDISYTSTVLYRNIESFKRIYPFLEVGSIGKTVIGNNIPFIRFGNGEKEIFYNASTHANEWITSPLLMKFTEVLCKAYVNDVPVFGYNPRELFNNVSLYIVPMVNIDGVDLVTGNLKSNTNFYTNAEKIAANFPTIPFPSGWKANIVGVDLNLQFPADWNRAKEIKYEQGFDKPAPRDFVGYGPLTAPEAIALYNFTLSHDFRLVIAYHTQGKVIYWQYQDYTPEESRAIVQNFARVSGYTPEDTPYESSFAGYKDWFIFEYRRPGFTVEAGIGVNPIPIAQFDSIYNDNLGILILGMVQ